VSEHSVGDGEGLESVSLRPTCDVGIEGPMRDVGYKVTMIYD